MKTLELGGSDQWACFGGIYSNYLALEAALAQVSDDPADRLLCLGDLGAFGPYPDRVFPLLKEHQVPVLQGNYDDTIGHQKSDC